MKSYRINPNFELKLIDRPLLRRKRGEELVEKLKVANKLLEDLEADYDIIEIDLHQATAMNKSFFLGAFGLRVKALGVTGFKSKYVFINNDTIKEEIENRKESII